VERVRGVRRDRGNRRGRGGALPRRALLAVAPIRGWQARWKNLYFGAAGVIWGLDYLVRLGATRTRLDFRPVLQRLLEASADEFATNHYSAHGSFL
jgi:hypothetical protein